MTNVDKRFSTVPLNRKEVYYTNCPLVSASDVDRELGFTNEEFKKIGVSYLYLRAREENNCTRTTFTTSTTSSGSAVCSRPSTCTPTSAGRCSLG